MAKDSGEQDECGKGKNCHKQVEIRKDHNIENVEDMTVQAMAQQRTIRCKCQTEKITFLSFLEDGEKKDKHSLFC